MTGKRQKWKLPASQCFLFPYGTIHSDDQKTRSADRGQVPQSRPLMKRSLQSLCHYGVLREWLPKLGTRKHTWDGLGMWSPWLKLMLNLMIFWRATYKDYKPSLVTWGQPVIMRTARQSLVLGCHLTWTTTYRILPTDFLKTSFFFNYKA